MARALLLNVLSNQIICIAAYIAENAVWSPPSGRPAQFLSATSAQATLKTNAVQQLAEQAGLPHLREYVVGKQFIVLYAHSDTDVVLLAVKHQRQLMCENTRTVCTPNGGLMR